MLHHTKMDPVIGNIGELVNVIGTGSGFTRRPGLVPDPSINTEVLCFGNFDNIGDTEFRVLPDLTIEARGAMWESTITTNEGEFLSIAAKDGILYAIVQRGGSRQVERFDPSAYTDTYSNGEVYNFTHIITPQAPKVECTAGKARLIRACFKLIDTQAMRIDTGRGLTPIPFRRFAKDPLEAPPAPFSGDVQVRAIGWRRASEIPLWRIEQSDPLPFTLVSVVTEWKDAE